MTNEDYIQRLNILYNKVLSFRKDTDYIVNQPQMDKLIAVLEFFLDAAKELDGRVEPVKLKPKEYDLLEALIANRNLALSREKLIKLVWNFDYEGDTRTVDVHIQRLRQKLGLSARLHTVYKTGYRLEL